MELRIKKLDPRAIVPKYATERSAGFDLHACLDKPVELQRHQKALIPTGLAMAIHPGWEGQVRPRSGLAWKEGATVLNSPGTIDSDYRGEVKVMLVNLVGHLFKIEHGDRIAQMIISPVQQVDFEEVEELDETERGSGGFGHTGS